MNTKTTCSITQGRKNIFDIAEKVQKSANFFTLTERGVPKIVILSAKKFENLMENKNRPALILGEKNGSYAESPHFFAKTLIIRDESRVVYLSGKDQNEKFKKEEELIKAQLYVEIIEKYKYPLESVEFGRYVKIGPPESKRYIEADLIINDTRGNVKFIFEVNPFASFEKNLDQKVQDLFDISNSVSWVRKPERLVCFSRSFGKIGPQIKIASIDCQKFNTFSAWKKAGRPAEKTIPAFGEASYAS